VAVTSVSAGTQWPSGRLRGVGVTQPSRMPALRNILRKAAGTKAIADTLTICSLEPLDRAGDELAAKNRREIEKWGKLVREPGIKPAN
jgi:tripartite-type tricarboxylate transporter receptor subunit TctC